MKQKTDAMLSNEKVTQMPLIKELTRRLSKAEHYAQVAQARLYDELYAHAMDPNCIDLKARIIELEIEKDKLNKEMFELKEYYRVKVLT